MIIMRVGFKIFFLLFSLFLFSFPSIANAAIISGELIDSAGNTLSVNISAYNPGTNTINVSTKTNQTGHYNLALVYGIYDIKYNFENFVVPNFFVKMNSVTVSNNIFNLLNLSNTTSKLLLSINLTDFMDFEIYSSTTPVNISIGDFILSKVQSVSDLTEGKWLFNSTTETLMLKYDTLVHTTTTTTVSSTTTTTTLPGDKTLYAGILPVTLDNESWHGAINENWNTRVVLDFGDGQLKPWFCQISGAPTQYSVDGGIVHIYKGGINATFIPESGYRKYTFDSTFNPTGDANIVNVQQGDVLELFDQSPKAYWTLRGNQIVGGGFNFIAYYTPVFARLTRDGIVYQGYGQYNHAWGKFTQYPTTLQSWYMLWVASDGVYLMVDQALGKTGEFSLQDGGLLFYDDMSYDVLGSSSNGYAYTITDGPNCDNFTIDVQTHRGSLTFDLLGLKRVAGSGCYFQTPIFTDVRITGAITDQAYASSGETARR